MGLIVVIAAILFLVSGKSCTNVVVEPSYDDLTFYYNGEPLSTFKTSGAGVEAVENFIGAKSVPASFEIELNPAYSAATFMGTRSPPCRFVFKEGQLIDDIIVTYLRDRTAADGTVLAVFRVDIKKPGLYALAEPNKTTILEYHCVVFIHE